MTTDPPWCAQCSELGWTQICANHVKCETHGYECPKHRCVKEPMSDENAKKRMGEEEGKALLIQIGLIGSAVLKMPLEELVHEMEHSMSVGPILDPSRFRGNGLEKLREWTTFAKKLLEVKHMARAFIDAMEAREPEQIKCKKCGNSYIPTVGPSWGQMCPRCYTVPDPSIQ